MTAAPDGAAEGTAARRGDGAPAASAPERTARRRPARLFAWVGGAAVVGAALWTLRGEWDAALRVASSVRPAWGSVLLASLAVLAAYAVLVATWRTCVADAGAGLSFGDSARIWFVSNLARYLPGALWQMGALAVLARERGASASAATSAAVVLTVVNTLAGLVVAFALAPAASVPALAVPPWLPVALGVLALAALRWIGPIAVRWVANATGRTLRLPGLGRRMIAAAVLGSLAAWVLYGVGFKVLVDATMPGVALAAGPAIAIYAASYLAGFLSLGPPAGLGVADGAMVWLLTAAGVASPAEAVVIAAVARLWRTILEIAPGLVLLAASQWSRGSRIP